MADPKGAFDLFVSELHVPSISAWSCSPNGRVYKKATLRALLEHWPVVIVSNDIIQNGILEPCRSLM